MIQRKYKVRYKKDGRVIAFTVSASSPGEARSKASKHSGNATWLDTKRIV